MNNIKPFRFWCQKVLPLAYDDSLSYYELLCKVVAKLNEVVDNENQLNETFQQLKEWVENYFDSIDFQQMVNNKLDEMTENGVLEDMIDNKLLGNIKFNQVFIADEDQNAFINDMLTCAVSYLINSMGSNSVVGEPLGRNTPFIAKYNNGNTYMGVLGQGEFISTDTEFYNGVEYPVVYLDCSGFVSLLTKCRDYESSTYFSAFNGGSINDQISRAYEKGTKTDKPYTLDFLQNITTYDEAYYLQKSGCPLHRLSENTEEKLNVNENAFKNLITGDILFFSTPTLTNRYKGIHHCAIYVKSLEQLNIYGAPYNVTFKKGYEPENDNDEYGFIIDCGGFVDAPNAIKISSLYTRMKYTQNEITYFIHPVSSCFNSTKAMNCLLGISPSYDSIYLVDRRQNRFGWIWNGIKIEQNPSTGYNSINLRNIITRTINVSGININRLGELIDLNAIPNGVYLCDSATVAQGILNTPYNNTPFILVQIGVLDDTSINRSYGMQFAVQQSQINAEKLKFRSSSYGAEWTEWETII